MILHQVADILQTGGRTIDLLIAMQLLQVMGN
jgi:hypothetical protein